MRACWKKQRGFCPQVFAVQMCASLQTCVQTFGSGSIDRSLSVPSFVRRDHSASRARSACSVVLKSSVALRDRALEPAWAKVILPPFHERGLKLDRENFLHDRDVLVQQLLLKIDRVRGDDRLALLLDCEKRRRDEISERLADAGAGFDDEMPLLLERCARSAAAIACCCGRYSKFRAFARRPSSAKIARTRSTKSLSRESFRAIMPPRMNARNFVLAITCNPEARRRRRSAFAVRASS